MKRARRTRRPQLRGTLSAPAAGGHSQCAPGPPWANASSRGHPLPIIIVIIVIAALIIAIIVIVVIVIFVIGMPYPCHRHRCPRLSLILDLLPGIIPLIIIFFLLPFL
eukprot:2582798-Pyramimonas_sp.AAC.1